MFHKILIFIMVLTPACNTTKIIEHNLKLNYSDIKYSPDIFKKWDSDKQSSKSRLNHYINNYNLYSDQIYIYDLDALSYADNLVRSAFSVGQKGEIIDNTLTIVNQESQEIQDHYLQYDQLWNDQLFASLQTLNTTFKEQDNHFGFYSIIDSKDGTSNNWSCTFSLYKNKAGKSDLDIFNQIRKLTNKPLDNNNKNVAEKLLKQCSNYTNLTTSEIAKILNALWNQYDFSCFDKIWAWALNEQETTKETFVAEDCYFGFLSSDDALINGYYGNIALK